MKEILSQLIGLHALGEDQTFSTLEQMMQDGGETPTDAQIAGYLFGTGCRMLTSSELVGAARCLRSHMTQVPLPKLAMLDTCGTGGSGFSTFNTSTAVAFVCAAAGQPVAKHGNRASTSKSGSADVLERLGLCLDLNAEQIAQSVQTTGFGFMFAPMHHAATKRVQRIRRELGFRTIFNFIGPLSNPAGAAFQLLGVSSLEMLPVMAEALRDLGTKNALVVRGEEGLDEISLTAPTTVYELRDQQLDCYTLRPEDFGFQSVEMREIEVASAEESAERMQKLFSGEPGPLRDLVLLNAGAALYVSTAAKDIAEGISLAQECIDSGKVSAKVTEVVEFTNGVSS